MGQNGWGITKIMKVGIFDRYAKFIVIPPFLWIGLFVIVAILLLTFISFSAPEFGVMPYKPMLQIKDSMAKISIDLNSYKALFEDSFYLKAFITSLQLAFISTFFTFILAYPMAYKIAQTSPGTQLLLLILVITPFWTSLLIRVYGWIIILKNQGLLNQLLLWLGIINTPLNILNSKTAIVIGIVYTYLPFMILPIYASISKIKPSIIEAAADLGAKPFYSFWQVIFPLSMPGVIIGVILVFIPAIGEFVIPDLLGGAKIMTIGKLLWTEFFMNRDWPMAAAITVLIIMIVVVPIKLLHRLVKE